MYTVLDKTYTIEEGQACYSGSEEECQVFISEQGGSSFMFEIVPSENLKKRHRDFNYVAHTDHGKLCYTEKPESK